MFMDLWRRLKETSYCRYWRFMRNLLASGSTQPASPIQMIRRSRTGRRFLPVVVCVFVALLVGGCTRNDEQGKASSSIKEGEIASNTQSKQEENNAELQEKSLAVSYTTFKEVSQIDPNILTQDEASVVLDNKIYHDFDETMWEKDCRPLIWYNTEQKKRILHLGENYYYEFMVRGVKVIPKDTIFLVHVGTKICYVSRGYGKKPERYRRWVEQIKSQIAKKRVEAREEAQQALKQSAPQLQYTTLPYSTDDGYLCGVVQNVSNKPYSGGTIYFFLRDGHNNKVAHVSGTILELKPGERAEFRIPLMYEMQRNPNIQQFEFDKVGWL